MGEGQWEWSSKKSESLVWDGARGLSWSKIRKGMGDYINRRQLGCLSSRESAFQEGDTGSIPGLGRSPGEGNSNPLQYSCLENPMDRGGWRGAVGQWPKVRHNLGTKQQTRLDTKRIRLDKKRWDRLIVLYSESCLVVSNSLGLRGLCSPWNSPGQNTGLGNLSLLQRIFPTQESNQRLLKCRQILYQLSYQGSPVLYRGWIIKH